MPRVARSNLAADAQSATIAEGEWALLRLAHEEFPGDTMEFVDVTSLIEKGVRATMISDCKALLDAECKSEAAGLRLATNPLTEAGYS